MYNQRKVLLLNAVILSLLLALVIAFVLSKIGRPELVDLGDSFHFMFLFLIITPMNIILSLLSYFVMKIKRKWIGCLIYQVSSLSLLYVLMIIGIQFNLLAFILIFICFNVFWTLSIVAYRIRDKN